MRGTPTWLGVANALTALRLVLESDEPVTRAQISDATGLSKQTIAQVVARLEKDGLIEQAGVHTDGPGRPAAQYRPRTADALALAIAVEADVIHARVLGPGGTEFDAVTVAHDEATVLSGLAQAVLGASEKAGVDPVQLRYACLGVPEPVDRTAQSEGWADRLRTQLEDTLRCRVEIHNDVNLAARAERAATEHPESATLGTLWIGEGVGFALDVAGTVLVGHRGMAGEIGLIPVHLLPAPGTAWPTASGGGVDGPNATTMGSGAAGPREFPGVEADELTIEDSLDRAALTLYAHRAGIDAAALSPDGLASSSREVPAPLLERIATVVAAALIPVLATVAPDAIVLTGPTSHACGPDLARSATDLIAARTRWRPRLELSALGSGAVLRGAELRCQEEANRLVLDAASVLAPGSGHRSSVAEDLRSLR